MSKFGRRHLETPFSVPRDTEILADPDFCLGSGIQLGFDLMETHVQSDYNMFNVL